MKEYFFVTAAETIIEAAGMNFSLFQFKHGKYGEYKKADVAAFIGLSACDIKKIAEEYQALKFS